MSAPPTDPGAIAGLAVVGAALVVGLLWRKFTNRGWMVGDEPDRGPFRVAGEALGLRYLPVDNGANLNGALEGCHVQIEARWHRRGRARNRSLFGNTRYNWEVQTVFRAAFGVPMPAGLHLRRQSRFGAFVDALVNGDEISTNDATFDDAYLVHCADVAAVDRVLSPAARDALLRLASSGDVWVDEQSVKVILPEYISGGRAMTQVLDRLVAVIREMRGGAPAAAPGVAARVPVAMTLTRPSLNSLVRKAAAAGLHNTQVGRELLATLPGQPCRLDVDVEHVEPFHHPTSGRADGLVFAGVLVAGTGRVDVHAHASALEGLGDVAPGVRLSCDGLLVRYDPMRDRAEVECEGAGSVQRSEAPATEYRAVPSPYTAQIDAALRSEDVNEVLAALYTGREARERMVGGLRGRQFSLSGALRDAAPTPRLRVQDAALRDGLTVQLAPPGLRGSAVAVRFPADRNDWLGQQEIGAALSLDVAFVEWDEMAGQAVFVERGD